jgi:serine protease inhibitor
MVVRSDDCWGISEMVHFINAPLQKAVVKVTGEGIEAAATAAYWTRSFGVSARYEMVVDRPFLLVAHRFDPNSAGCILFMGVVFDPSPSSR